MLTKMMVIGLGLGLISALGLGVFFWPPTDFLGEGVRTGAGIALLFGGTAFALILSFVFEWEGGDPWALADPGVIFGTYTATVMISAIVIVIGKGLF